MGSRLKLWSCYKTGCINSELTGGSWGLGRLEEDTPGLQGAQKFEHLHSSTLMIVLHGLIELPAAAAKSLQSCPTLCDPIDGSPPGSAIPGILQARTLEWVAISSSAWKWKVKVKSLSRVQLFATPWTEAYQAPLSMGFSRQEYGMNQRTKPKKLKLFLGGFLKKVALEKWFT